MKTTRASLPPISKTPAVLTAILLSGIFSTSLVAETFEKNLEASFPVVSGGKLAKLIIQADRGSIKVVTDSSDKVQIHVFREIKGGTRARADELFANHEVKFLEDPTTVSVVAKTKDNKIWSRIRNNLQVRYEVNIPKKFDVDLNTSGGDIILDDLQGEAVAHTSSGAIKLANITGRVEARDSGGNISIEAADSVTARTSSGMIHIRQAAGKVEASNSGGDIRIESAGSDIVAETSSGKITVMA